MYSSLSFELLKVGVLSDEGQKVLFREVNYRKPEPKSFKNFVLSLASLLPSDLVDPLDRF